MSRLSELTVEINQNFNDLGAVLVLLQALTQAVQTEHDYPQEYVEAGLERMEEHVRQYTKDVCYLSGLLVKESLRSAVLPAR